MFYLTQSRDAWNTAEFNDILKAEIMQLDIQHLPLQQALTQSSYTDGHNRSVVILNNSENADTIHIKLGIFFTGILPGCACSDDPSPNNEYNEYCELQLTIDKTNGESIVELLD